MRFDAQIEQGILPPPPTRVLDPEVSSRPRLLRVVAGSRRCSAGVETSASAAVTPLHVDMHRDSHAHRLVITHSSSPTFLSLIHI
eukprot:1636428-Rhodomonas_salina.1